MRGKVLILTVSITMHEHFATEKAVSLFLLRGAIITRALAYLHSDPCMLTH